MRSSSPLKVRQEERSRVRHYSSCGSRKDDATVRIEAAFSPSYSQSAALSAPSSSSVFYVCSGERASASDTSGRRAAESLSGRSGKQRRKRGAVERKKNRKSSKMSRKRKSRRKSRRLSTSSSSSSPSRSPSHRSISRPRFRATSLEASRRVHCRPSVTSSFSSSSSSSSASVPFQADTLNKRKAATGWDVGPKGSLCTDTPSPQGCRCVASSSSAFWRAQTGDARDFRQGRSAADDKEEKGTGRHDPKTYQKAFGLAMPSGQYGFVSEDTDLLSVLPDARPRSAESHESSFSLAGRSLPPSVTTQLRAGSAATSDSATAPPTHVAASLPSIGVLRLLKEAGEAEKRRQGEKGGSGANEARKFARGGEKVTSKSHPHLFWQCWSCSADNYKTRHQCHRCNRLYMQ